MSNIALSSQRSWPGLAQFGRSLTRVMLGIGVVLQVRRERRELLGLDEKILKDIGFNRGDAHAEANRSFWDVPVDRLRM